MTAQGSSENDHEVLASKRHRSQPRCGSLRAEQPRENSHWRGTSQKAFITQDFKASVRDPARVMSPSRPIFLICTSVTFSTLRHVQRGRTLEEARNTVSRATRSPAVPPIQWFSKQVPQSQSFGR